MIEKTSQDYEDLKTAVNLLETPSLTVKIANLIGTPLESALQFLPNGAQEKIHEVVRSALHKSANAALWSLENKPEETTASNFLHKVMVATTGAIGGAFGFAALAVELPITTTIMLLRLCFAQLQISHEVKDSIYLILIPNNHVLKYLPSADLLIKTMQPSLDITLPVAS